MSRPRPQANGSGYMNGANNSSAAHLHRFNFDDSSRDNSADERSRSRGPGGYGGFNDQSSGSRVQAPARLNRERAQRRSRDENAYSNSRSRSRPGRGVATSGRAGTQVEEILRYIEQQWSIMASSSCLPIKVALQLNDPSSLGLMHQYDQFQETHRQLQNALKVIVNEHHQGFNSSIGTFHKIQAAIHASQHRVRTLRAGLVAAKGSLASTRPELKAFSQGSQSYDQMLQVLGTIEQLQAVPEKLEAEISEKRFLAAVDSLQEALKLMRKPEMEEIGALSDLRVYLSNQEHSLTDILVEELHSHLYLKSPYCEERWTSHARRDVGSVSLASDERALHSFLEVYDGTKQMQEDTTRNPEADTFYYIQLLVESLNKMSRLDVAADAIEQRLPVELFRVVERSHSEVEQRHPSTLRSSTRNRPETLAMNEGPDGERKATLEDLLTTLFAKFEAIAEGHCVLHSVTAAILKREGLLDGPTLNRSFRELWKLLQSEIRSLLHDHLATNGNMGHRTKQESDQNANIFKPQPRNRNRRLFKLSETDDRSTEFATEREDLEYILKASVPGLVNSNSRDPKKERDDAPTLPDRSATGHKLLVEPSVFNMGILLPPCLSFLERLREVVPANSSVVASSLTSFLDDFLTNVFYPQLEETLLDLCSQALDGADAFHPHPSWQQHAPRPIFTGTVNFYQLLTSVCTLLDALPHDQSFAQLVIDQMRAYYDRSFAWSKSLLQKPSDPNAGEQGADMCLAAVLATDSPIMQPTIDLLTSSDPAATTALLEASTTHLLTHASSLTTQDLILDPKTLAALCTQHTSTRWLIAQTAPLAHLSPLATSSAKLSPTINQQASDKSLPPPPSSTLPPPPYLPLSSTTLQQFEGVQYAYAELSSLLLRTLHLDMRLHLLHGVATALSHSYALGQPYNDPDPTILSLSASLSQYHSTLTAHLLPHPLSFLTKGLDVVGNATFIQLVHLVPTGSDGKGGMDAWGRERMGLNVLVCGQVVKGLMGGSGGQGDLGKARRFWEIGGLGDGAEMKRVGAEQGFGEEELGGLVRVLGL